MDRQSTTVTTIAKPGSPGLTFGEISAVIERRLSWYGRSGMTLDAVELKGRTAIVVRLRDARNTVYREVIDARTRRLVARDVLQSEVDPPGEPV